MSIKVPFLSYEQIEQRTQCLLRTWSRRTGKPIQPPIPVEEILEQELKLSLAFDDLQEVLGIPDVLGALWVKSREVLIDQSLVPDEHPEMEGRFNFSIGHESGHWVLHRNYLADANVPTVMLRHNVMARMLICRLGQARERIETQADQFAAALLMPKDLVLDACERRFKRRDPFEYRPQQWRDFAALLEKPKMQHVSAHLRNIGETRPPVLRLAFQAFASCLAPQFRVSAQAMRIRLENLGLLKVPPSLESGMPSSYSSVFSFDEYV